MQTGVGVIPANLVLDRDLGSGNPLFSFCLSHFQRYNFHKGEIESLIDMTMKGKNGKIKAIDIF